LSAKGEGGEWPLIINLKIASLLSVVMAKGKVVVTDDFNPYFSPFL
jgi:hypothetical protein